jgi:hypothetical protein
MGSVLAAATMVAACSAAPAPSSDPQVAAPLTAGDPTALTDLGAAAPACAIDTDCGTDALCVEHVCHRACRWASDCAAGSSCNMDNHGDCFNAPGCNPAPAGEKCSLMCWGWCDLGDGG